MSTTGRFQNLVTDAKSRIEEITVQDFTSLPNDKKPLLIDVREDSDWQESHAQDAIHLSRGVIELKIEDRIPDVATPIVVYCGGGSRSALAADSLQKMGYTNVLSLAGGYKAWKESGSPVTRENN